ncbi:hypothetical protein QTI24_03880 [Variovorax sp. J22P240]|uniref:hypothetical protein n=1 Tax=Variovorax sp. J22P240 TaxID=3053514 RepID=UPI002579054C|nr:hypothetical protein [Variovorax sp. J22P240]MDL9997730.1 hypothetical protein [Variovorax sp. J22P240]
MTRHVFTGSASSIVVGCVLGTAVVCGGLGFVKDAQADRQVRGGARTSVNHNVNANRNVSTNTNVNRNANINRNTNVNVNQNVNVNVAGGRYDDHYHPVATAAAVTAGVAITAAAVGSIVRSLPPSCTAAVVNGITYQNCGGAWYQPQYAGSQVTYVVVNPPG